jgi:DNA polymerase-1
MGERLIADIETDGLLDVCTKVHCIQLGTVDGDDVTVYTDALPGYPSLAEGLERVRNSDELIGHNFISFDFEALTKLHPGAVRREQVRDTLVMSRLFDPEERAQSLWAWGERLGVAKGDFEGPWDTCTPEMLTYARQDIVVTRALYQKVRVVESWGTSCQLEHDVAWAICAQERNGFCFDVKAAQQLDVQLRVELDVLTKTLKDTFPPIEKTAVIVPKVNNKARGYVKGQPFTKRWMVEFNPASRQHVGERLLLLGWKPKAFGANGKPTVDEGTIAVLPYPEAKPLAAYYKTLKKLGQLSDGDNAWLKSVRPAGRIHGRVNPNGACTGRMSHFKPNVAQADKDARMRALWVPKPGWKLVGCDAEGLEARMLAHYLARYDGGVFGDRVVHGDSAKRTDVHSANFRALIDFGLLPEVLWDDPKGFKLGRNGVKTILYALMYGAGDFKLGSQLREIWRDAKAAGCPKCPPKELGRMVRMALAKAMKGLDHLVDKIKATAKANGFVTGLDGRHVHIRSEHSALNTLLQGAGAIVMKKALVLFMEIHGDHHGTSFGLCANVHDEVQMEVIPSEAELYGHEMAQAITRAGELLGLRCPLAGKSDVGDNWSQTH